MGGFSHMAGLPDVYETQLLPLQQTGSIKCIHLRNAFLLQQKHKGTINTSNQSPPKAMRKWRKLQMLLGFTKEVLHRWSNVRRSWKKRLNSIKMLIFPKWAKNSLKFQIMANYHFVEI
jgi:hypothetical protein